MRYFVFRIMLHVFLWLGEILRFSTWKTTEAMDGASCAYLLGRKIQGYIPDTDIVAGYVGAKHISHT